MKQTAVEWLFKWMIDNKDLIIEERLQAFEQAKEMEKEHKIDFALTVYSEIVETDKDFVDVIKSMNL